MSNVSFAMGTGSPSFSNYNETDNKLPTGRIYISSDKGAMGLTASASNFLTLANPCQGVIINLNSMTRSVLDLKNILADNYGMGMYELFIYWNILTSTDTRYTDIQRCLVNLSNVGYQYSSVYGSVLTPIEGKFKVATSMSSLSNVIEVNSIHINQLMDASSISLFFTNISKTQTFVCCTDESDTNYDKCSRITNIIAHKLNSSHAINGFNAGTVWGS